MTLSARSVIVTRTLSFRFLIATVATVFALVGAEGAARVLWHWQYNRFLTSQYSGYQMLDANRGITVLRPGIRLTLKEFIASLKQHDRSLAVTLLQADSERYGIGADEIVFQVNKLGLLGPEVEQSKPHDVVRVLAAGDSVTFGPYITKLGYPRVMERELNQIAAGRDVKYEVLNAGVQGYNIEAVRKRMDEFVALAPDVVTILIGWNRTILRADPKKNGSLYRHLAVYRFFYHGVLDLRRGELNMPGAAENTYDPADPIIGKLRATSFESDFEDWTAIVRTLKRRLPRCRIVALTLPGIFIEGREPEPEAKAKAFSLAFTPNLYGWAVLADAYNQKLKEFSAPEHIEVIDLAEWSKTSFRPRHQYFVDTVHLTPEGYDLMGRHIARELLKVSASTPDRRTGPVQQSSGLARRRGE